MKNEGAGEQRGQGKGRRAFSQKGVTQPRRWKGSRTMAAVWLRLQVRYDLEVAERELSERINREVKVRPQPHNRLQP